MINIGCLPFCPTKLYYQRTVTPRRAIYRTTYLLFLLPLIFLVQQLIPQTFPVVGELLKIVRQSLVGTMRLFQLLAQTGVLDQEFFAAETTLYVSTASELIGRGLLIPIRDLFIAYRLRSSSSWCLISSCEPSEYFLQGDCDRERDRARSRATGQEAGGRLSGPASPALQIPPASDADGGPPW